MIPYDTIEIVNNQADLPVWSTVWLPVAGCNSRTVYYNTPIGFTNPPTVGHDQYSSGDERRSRSRPSTGKRHPGAYPPYRYTDHSVSSEITRNYLVRRSYGTAGLDVYYQYGVVAKVGGACTPVPTNMPHTGPLFSQWNTVQHDFAVTNYTVHGFDTAEISAAKAAVQAEVQKEASTSYDLLTDIAEMRDVPRTLRTVAGNLTMILHSLRRLHGREVMKGCSRLSAHELLKHPNKWFRKFGDDWMAYRYGIMPLVYSYNDLRKTANRHSNVTTRKQRIISPSDLGVSLPGSSVIYKKTSIEGSVTVRGSIFQSFSSDEISRLSGLGFNPLVTAWELIPYSFVIDWFVNVGDYIAAKTGGVWSRQKWACLSQHDNYTVRTEVHLPNQDQTISISNRFPTNWYGTQPPAPSPVILNNPEGLFLLKEVIVDRYSRWVFDIGAAQLQFNPSLNWRRLIDAGVMSLNNLRSLMRSLR